MNNKNQYLKHRIEDAGYKVTKYKNVWAARKEGVCVLSASIKMLAIKTGILS